MSEDAKAKILVNKNVTAIETSEASVRVHSADGTIEEGDMVIGADGVHSTTRQITRQLAAEAAPPGASLAVNKEKPWFTTYRVLYGNMPKTDDLTAGDVYESHGKGACLQFFIGSEHTWFFVYSTLATPTSERAYYSQQAADDYAETYGNLHITDKLLFRDVYAKRRASGLANLEEGVMRHWSWDRIVLVGDAAHKITPNIGWGFNSSVHDLVVLVNGLRALLQSQNTKAGEVEITTAALQTLFKKYQAERMAHMQQTAHISAHYTRLSAWKSGWKTFLDRYVFPHVGADNILVNYAVGAQIRTIPVLDWLDEPHYKEGRVPWGNVPLAGEDAVGTRKASSWGWSMIEAIMPSVISML